MTRNGSYEFDNRNSEEMYTYLEARVEALKRRISELETENARLRSEMQDSRYELSSAICA